MVSDRKREVLLSLRKTGLPATTLLLIVDTISFVIAPTRSKPRGTTRRGF